jgi:hypothetical protein
LARIEIHRNSRGVYCSEPSYDGLFLLEKHAMSWDLCFAIGNRIVNVSGTRNWPYLHLSIIKDTE